MNPNVHKSHTWFESQICFYFNAIPPASLQSSVIGQNKTILSVPPQRTLPSSRFPGSAVPTIHSPQRAERPPSTAFFLFLGSDRDWYVARSSRLSPQAPQELRQSGGRYRYSYCPCIWLVLLRHLHPGASQLFTPGMHKLDSANPEAT